MSVAWGERDEDLSLGSFRQRRNHSITADFANDLSFLMGSSHRLGKYLVDNQGSFVRHFGHFLRTNFSETVLLRRVGGVRGSSG